MDLKPSTLVDLLEMAAAKQAYATAFTFFDDHHETKISYHALKQKAEAIAKSISTYAEPKEHVLIIYPTGIEFIAAFFGCMYAGVTVIPLSPPVTSEQNAMTQRIINTVKPALCLSSGSVLDQLKKARIAKRIQHSPLMNKITAIWKGKEALATNAWDAEKLIWLDSAKINLADAKQYQRPSIEPATIAMILYTGGLVHEPRGVVLTHQMVVNNLVHLAHEFELKETDVNLSWLPLTQSMGLILGILQPMYHVIPSYLMSSLAFYERPARWLEAIAKYRASLSGAPNSAYELCIHVISPDDKKKLHLNHWEVAYFVGECVRSDTIDNFYQLFKSCGIRKEIFSPMYGLSENTFFAFGSLRNQGASLVYVDKNELSLLKMVALEASDPNAKALVAYEQGTLKEQCLIVNRETGQVCPDGVFGEIWLASDSTAKAYWQLPEETKKTFQQAMNEQAIFLRTGDTACVKNNQIIVIGNNDELIHLPPHYYSSQEIEANVNSCHSDLAPGTVVALGIDPLKQAQLLIIAEVGDITEERAKAIFSTIRRAVSDHHGIQVQRIALIQQHSIKKTAIGTIRRYLMKKLYLLKQLNILHEWALHRTSQVDWGFLPSHETSSESKTASSFASSVAEEVPQGQAEVKPSYPLPTESLPLPLMGNKAATAVSRPEPESASIRANPFIADDEWVETAKEMHAQETLLSEPKQEEQAVFMTEEKTAQALFLPPQESDKPLTAEVKTEPESISIRANPFIADDEFIDANNEAFTVEESDDWGFAENKEPFETSIDSPLSQETEELASSLEEQTTEPSVWQFSMEPEETSLEAFVHQSNPLTCHEKQQGSFFVEEEKAFTLIPDETFVSPASNTGSRIERVADFEKESAFSLAPEDDFIASPSPTKPLSEATPVMEEPSFSLIQEESFVIPQREPLPSQESNPPPQTMNTFSFELEKEDNFIKTPDQGREIREKTETTQKDADALFLMTSEDKTTQSKAEDVSFAPLKVDEAADEAPHFIAEEKLAQEEPLINKQDDWLFPKQTPIFEQQPWMDEKAFTHETEKLFHENIIFPEENNASNEAKEPLSAQESSLMPNTLNAETPKETLHEPIAVIGISCRFPGADDIEAYWQLISTQKTMISELPITRWENQTYCTTEEAKPIGGFLQDVDQFDADFFALTRQEAELLDPQHRLLLEVTWDALVSANLDLKSLKDSKTSVFTGIASNDYGYLLRSQSSLPLDNELMTRGNAASGAAGRIAYYFGLRGSTVAIDTADSSSLVAIHEACQDLQAGYSTLSIAGGVNLLLMPRNAIHFSGDTSKIGGEGCGVVILKRLSDAERDGNTILAVIAGSAVNHDSAGEALTAPHEEAQIHLLQEALTNAHLRASDIDYIETVGIDKTNDPEFAAIQSVFNHSEEKPLLTGSVKANIGHLDAAAGIAGFIKVVLALQHDCIPANVEEESRKTHEPALVQISLPNSPWTASGHKRRAGVSAFGFTGTNAHIILEESPAALMSLPTTVKKPFHRQRYWIPFKTTKETPLPTVFPESTALNDYYHVSWIAGREIAKPQPTMLLPSTKRLKEKLTYFFSALGINLTAYPSFEKALHCLSVTYIGNALIQMGWQAKKDENVDLVEWMQKAHILPIHHALMHRLFRILVDEEVLALIHGDTYRVNKDLSFIDAKQQVDIIQKNFSLQQVELSQLCYYSEHLASLLQGKMSLEQISQESMPQTSLLTIAYNRLIAATVKAILEKWPQDTPLTILEIGGGLLDAEPQWFDDLKDYPLHYVYADYSEDHLRSYEHRLSQYDFIEYRLFDIDEDPFAQGFLPHSFSLVLATRGFSQASRLNTILSSVHQLLAPGGMLILREYTRSQRFLELSHGLEEKWWQFDDGDIRKDYPLLNSEDWKHLLASQGFSDLSVYHDPVSQTGQSILFAKTIPIIQETNKSWLIFADSASNHLTIDLSAQLKSVGKTIIRVEPSSEFIAHNPTFFQISPLNANDFTTLFKALENKSIEGVIYLWPCGKLSKTKEDGLHDIFSAAFHLVQQLLKKNAQTALWIVTQGVNQIQLEIPRGFQQAPLWGWTSAINAEHPDLPLYCVDLDATYTPEMAAYMLFQQLWSDPDERQRCLRQHTRFIARFVPFIWPKEVPLPAVNTEGCYLITGGTTALGLTIIEWLIQEGVRYFLVLDNPQTAIPEQAFAPFKSRGATIDSIYVDITNKNELAEVLQKAEQRLPKLVAIIHAAGATEDLSPTKKNWASYQRQFAIKVQGAWNLHRLTHHYPIHHFMMCSSIVSCLGLPEQSLQAASNAYLDKLAHYRHAIGLPALSVNWGKWEEEKNPNPSLAGLHLLTKEQLWQGLGLLWTVKNKPQLAFADIDWSLLRPQLQGRAAFLSELMDFGSKKTFEVARTEHPTTLLARLKRSAPSARLALLIEYLREQAARVLSQSVESVQDIHKGFMDLGMDSLKATAFRQAIETSMGEGNLPITVIYENPTIERLSQYILQFYQLDFPLLKQGHRQQAYLMPQKRTPEDDIAIIAYSCRFPNEADTPEKVWQLLSLHENVIKPVPANRRQLMRWHDTNLAQGGFLENIDQFDAGFFGFSADEATYMDPQQRLLLEVSWEALERAGIGPFSLRGENVGVYVGISTNDYASLISPELKQQHPQYVPLGNALSVAAGRLSHFFGWEGPSLSVDTDCSSALSAIHLAVSALRHNDCSMAVVGTANLILNPVQGIHLARSNKEAEDGYCKVFDELADGFMRSEGCSVFILKRLSNALKEKDIILGVIKGTVINQDGANAGLTAPSLEAQKSLLEKTLQDAQLEPQQIDYIEANGSGTIIGDALELHAMSSLFTAREHPLLIGSIKSNLGHTEAVAGAASLIKVLLSFCHESIPANLHFKQLNQAIDLKKMPAQIVTTNTAWPKQQNHTRRAGVSAFGFNGTNAHLIVEEAPPLSFAEEGIEKPAYLFTLSAKSPTALMALIERYSLFLKQTELPLSAICYTANAGRAHFSYRIALLAKDKEALVQALSQDNVINSPALSPTHSLQERIESTIQQGPINDSTTAYYDYLQEVASLYLQGGDITWDLFYKTPQAKVILPTYCFERQSYWLHQEEALPATSSHPVLGSVLASALDQYVFTLYLANDHALSMSQYAINQDPIMPMAGFVEWALNAGKYLFKNEALQLHHLVLQTPLALSEDTVKTIQVIAEKKADKMAVSIYSKKNKNWEKHAHCIVQAASIKKRTPLPLCSIRDRLTEVINIQPFYKALVQQGISLGSTAPTINRLWISPKELFAEFTPSYSLDPYLCHPALLESCFHAFSAQKFFMAKEGKPLYLPLGFDRLSFYDAFVQPLYLHAEYKEAGHSRLMANAWIYDKDGNLLSDIEGFHARVAEKRTLYPSIDGPAINMAHCYEITEVLLKESLMQKEETEAKTWLLLCSDQQMSDHIKEQVKNTSIEWRVVILDKELKADKKEALTACLLKHSDVHKIIYWFTSEEDVSTPIATEKAAIRLLLFFQAFLPIDFTNKPSIEWITEGAHPFKNKALDIVPSASLGLYKSFLLEHPEIDCHHIDLDITVKRVDQLKQLSEEWLSPERETSCLFRNKKRYGLRLMQHSLTMDAYTSPLNANGSYLVTDGLSEIGRIVTEWLIHKGARHIILLSDDHPSMDAERFLQGLQKLAFIDVQQTDLETEETVHALIARFNQEWPMLCGIIHTTGAIHSSLVSNESPVVQSLFKSKVYGGWNLHKACLDKEVDLDFFILFSSMASVLGDKQHRHLAAANSFLDNLASYRHQRGLPASSINWGAWADVAMADNFSEEKGFLPLPIQDNLRVLTEAVTTNKAELIVAGIKWPRYLKSLKKIPTFLKTIFVEEDVNDGHWLKQLMGVASEQQMPLLQSRLVSLLQALLPKENWSGMPTRVSFFDRGMDATLAMALRHRLQQDFGEQIVIPPTMVFDYPSIETLTGKLAELIDMPPNNSLLFDESSRAFDHLSFEELVRKIDDESL